MKQIFFSVIFLSISLIAAAQNSRRIQKSWIKTSTENLSQNEIAPDTLYTRYTFDKSRLYISFYPGWDDYQQAWSLNKDNITIGFDVYHIDELTDTSLSIRLDGFRKFNFTAEDYFTNKSEFLDFIGFYDGKPLYRANKFITPRYIKGQPLATILQKNTEGYNIKRANHFLMRFIVTEKGEIKNVEIVKGITYGFDKEIIEQLQSTSKHWTAARYKSNSIQTEMVYEIKFLDSIVR